MAGELRWLELRHLRLVRAVVDCGTLTRAARIRGATQSALSQQLLDLEERMGAALFVRGKRRMMLTDVGRGFLERAEAVLAEQAELEAYVNCLEESDAGVLHLAIDNIVALGWLPEVARRFRERYAKVELRIERSADIVRDLIEERLDVAIAPPREATARVEFLPLFSDEMVVVLPPRHALTRKRVVTAADIAGHDLIYHLDLEESALYRSFLAPAKVKLRSFTQVEQVDAVLELVKAGFGLTVLPRMTIARDLEADAVEVRSAAAKTGGIVVSWSAAVRSGPRKPFIGELIELIRETAPKQVRPR